MTHRRVLVLPHCGVGLGHNTTSGDTGMCSLELDHVVLAVFHCLGVCYSLEPVHRYRAGEAMSTGTWLP